MAVPQGYTDSPEVLDRFNAELGIVEGICAQIARSIKVVEFDDLMSAGREGLLDAARRFDDARGVPFRAYAILRIRGAVIDSVGLRQRLSVLGLGLPIVSKATRSQMKGTESLTDFATLA